VTAPLFLADFSDPQLGGELELSGDEAHHALAVRRVTAGEEVLLADGRGLAVRGPVLQSAKGVLRVRVDEVLSAPEPALRHVAVQALPKGEHAELAVDLLTELGVDEIVPWQAERSVVRWSAERAERGLRRWRSAAREATKQSRRFRVPQVSGLHTTADVVRRVREATLALTLHETASTPLAGTELPASGELLFIVGPEGGLSDAELVAFTAAGSRPVVISDAVLRASVAGAAALAQLRVLAERAAL
jgi:16S rRNA (uracil1498-N3)-methyltransferase